MDLTLSIIELIGSTGIIVFLFFGLAIWLQPEWLIARLRKRSPEVLYSVETDEPVVALTIDDSPDAQHSAEILELLNRHQSRATFFMITGRIPGNEGVVQRMVEEGHELGNHLTRDEPSIALSNEEFERELVKADKVLSQYAHVVWVRPGSGWYNQEMLATIKKRGYRTALGSVYPYDPQIGFAWYMAQYVLWKVRPGAVIVLHDYLRRGQRTIRALEIILPKLAERGYRVVTLSELAAVNGG